MVIPSSIPLSRRCMASCMPLLPSNCAPRLTHAATLVVEVSNAFAFNSDEWFEFLK